jgi:hypothetical protein
MLVELMSPRSPAETWPGWNRAFHRYRHARRLVELKARLSGDRGYSRPAPTGAADRAPPRARGRPAAATSTTPPTASVPLGATT